MERKQIRLNNINRSTLTFFVRSETVWVFLFVKMFQFNLSDAHSYEMILTHFTPLKGFKRAELNLVVGLFEKRYFYLINAISVIASLFVKTRHIFVLFVACFNPFIIRNLKKIL